MRLFEILESEERNYKKRSILDDFLYDSFVDGEFTFDASNDIKYTKIILWDDDTWYYIDTKKKMIYHIKRDYDYYDAEFNTGVIFDFFENGISWDGYYLINEDNKDFFNYWSNEFSYDIYASWSKTDKMK